MAYAHIKGPQDLAHGVNSHSNDLPGRELKQGANAQAEAQAIASGNSNAAAQAIASASVRPIGFDSDTVANL